MKPFCSYLLSLGLIGILTLGFGCSSKEEFIPELSVSLENIDTPTTRVVTFGNEGGNISMQIKANAQWEIHCPNNWINLSHNKGTGNQSVTISVAHAKESRSAVLKISLVEYKQESVSIDIIQHYTPDEPKDDDPDNNEGNPSDKPSNPDQGDDGSGGDNPNENPSDKEEPTDPEPGDDPNKPNDDGGDNQGGENGDGDGDGNGNEGDGNEGDGQGGEGGEGIDPDEPKDNPEDQEPEEPTKEPQPISIADLRSLMDEEMQSVTIDDEYDRVLTAIVMNDCNANNFYNNHLYLSEEGATSAENGITLSGKLVSPQNLGVNMGDKVQITLKAQNAVVIKYNGRYEVTGEAGSEWMEMEILNSGNEITPIEIIPKDLLSYQAMTVTLKDVEPTSSGRWHSTENEGYTKFISSDGTPFKVYVYTQALFSANEYHATKGDITGIVTVENNEAILCPRNLADVYDFNGAPADDSENSGNNENPENGEDNGDSENGEDNGDPENGDNNNDSDQNQGDNNNPDQGEDKPSDKEDNNGTEGDVDDSEGNEDDNLEDITTAYTLIESTKELKDGKYYIGGYKDATLYLATGSLTEQNHCTTKSFEFKDDKITPLEDAEAMAINLIQSQDQKGYYIQFSDERFLTATKNSAGALKLSAEKSEYWIFSEHSEGGFILKQSGKVNVKLIISKRAKSDILRSIDGEESGEGVILIRIN